MWDSDTLADERKARPTMAAAILGNPPDLGDPIKLRKRIADFQANRREDDPAWWNDLAGAHIRLGESKTAADLLETVIARFPNDYGIHANLGTAYHLLGRYAEAERHIARDLEINPDAHFGLEKYHLALLQYLIRDAKYQSRHVYVDEFTYGFLNAGGGLYLSSDDAEIYFRQDAKIYTNGLVEAEADFESFLKLPPNESNFRHAMGVLAALDEMPAYRNKWNLANDTNLLDGVIYMASLNPKEPACFVILGVVSWKHRDLNLAVKAFEKAVALGSPQKAMLEAKVQSIRGHIREARAHRQGFLFSIAGACGLLILAIIVLRAIIRYIRR